MSEAARASVARAPEWFTPTPPDEEDEPYRSFRLRFVTGFYLLATISGGLTVASLVLLGMADVDDTRAKMLDHPVAMLSKPLSLASTWITWRLLRQRRRFGAVVAAIPFIQAAYTRFTAVGAGWLELGFPLVGVLLIASIWKELE